MLLIEVGTSLTIKSMIFKSKKICISNIVYTHKSERLFVTIFMSQMFTFSHCALGLGQAGRRGMRGTSQGFVWGASYRSDWDESCWRLLVFSSLWVDRRVSISSHWYSQAPGSDMCSAGTVCWDSVHLYSRMHWMSSVRSTYLNSCRYSVLIAPR